MERDVSCPVCAAGDPDPVAELGEYRVLLCRQCELRYSHPMRAASEGWYEACPYYADMRGAKRRKPAKEVLAGDWRYRQILSHVPPGGQRLVDVGCGVGEFVHVARELGYDATGIDHDRVSIDRGRDLYGQGGIRYSTVADLLANGAGETYDIVTMFDVLEHLEDPLEAVREVAALLPAGGRVVVNVPCWQRWPRVLGKVGDFPPHHLTMWSPDALRRTLEQAGFSPEVLCRKPLHSSDLLEAFRAMVPWIRGQSLFKKVLRRFLWKGVAAPVAVILRLKADSGGFSLFAVGRKP